MPAWDFLTSIFNSEGSDAFNNEGEGSGNETGSCETKGGGAKSLKAE